MDKEFLKKLADTLREMAESKRDEEKDESINNEAVKFAMDIERHNEILDTVKENKITIPNMLEGITQIKGDTGVKGDTGTQGEQGIQGLQGDKGKQGEKGNKGDNGKNGTDGKNGKDGAKGKDGTNGKDGLKGKDGNKGNDGSQDTGLDIVNKINDLPISPSSMIDASHIKNLPTVMTGGGGGVRRNVSAKNIREDLSSQCDGATKTFTIAGNYKEDTLQLFSTQFPIVYRPVVDFTETGGGTTLTSEVGAPQTGQTLVALYEKK